MSQPNESTTNKVLILAHVFPPFQSVGGSIRVVKFIKYLLPLGWLPVVLTIDDQMEYETMRKVGSDALLSEIRPQPKIYRTTSGEPSLKYLEKEREFGRRNWLTSVFVKGLSGSRRWILRNLFLPDRYVAWLPFALRRGRQIVRSEGIDAIFATCPPFSVALVGVCLKRITGKPLVLDFRDDWVGTPWYHSKPATIRMIDRIMERWSVKIADKVITVTEWSEQAFHERYPNEQEDTFVLIPNGCDLAEFAVLKSSDAAPRNSKFTIVHVGSLYRSRNLTRSPAAFLQAVGQLLQRQTDLAGKVTVAFAGDFPEQFRRLAEAMGLSGVIEELGYLSHDQVLRLIASADLLLTIATERFSTAIPGKIYEYWAVGGPPILLLSYPGASTSLVERYGLGFTVEPSDLVGIASAILTAYRHDENGTPLRISTAGIEAYDRRTLTEKLAQVLYSVCDQQRRSYL